MGLINTRLLELRAMSPELDKWTLRPSQYGAWDVFKLGNGEPNSVVSEELRRKAATAVGRTLKVPVYDAETVSIGSTRSVTITDTANTSQLVTISFTTYTFGFTQTPAYFMNNELDAKTDWNRKFLKYAYKLAETVDTDCLAALSTNKSQVFGDLLGYTNTGNVIIAANASREEIIGDLTPMMNSNDYYGSPYHMIGNMGLSSIVNKMEEKGLYNDVNKKIQFGDKELHWTNRLANGGGHKATGYLVNPGSVGYVIKHEREAILGTKSGTSHEWGIDSLPILGVPMDTYYYEGVSDYSATDASTTDMTRAWTQFYGFAVEIGYVVSYTTNLAAQATPIIKFAVTTA